MMMTTTIEIMRIVVPMIIMQVVATAVVMVNVVVMIMMVTTLTTTTTMMTTMTTITRTPIMRQSNGSGRTTTVPATDEQDAGCPLSATIDLRNKYGKYNQICTIVIQQSKYNIAGIHNRSNIDQ